MPYWYDKLDNNNFLMKLPDMNLRYWSRFQKEMRSECIAHDSALGCIPTTGIINLLTNFPLVLFSVFFFVFIISSNRNKSNRNTTQKHTYYVWPISTVRCQYRALAESNPYSLPDFSLVRLQVQIQMSILELRLLSPGVRQL